MPGCFPYLFPFFRFEQQCRVQNICDIPLKKVFYKRYRTFFPHRYSRKILFDCFLKVCMIFFRQRIFSKAGSVRGQPALSFFFYISDIRLIQPDGYLRIPYLVAPHKNVSVLFQGNFSRRPHRRFSGQVPAPEITHILSSFQICRQMRHISCKFPHSKKIYGLFVSFSRRDRKQTVSSFHSDRCIGDYFYPFSVKSFQISFKRICLQHSSIVVRPMKCQYSGHIPFCLLSHTPEPAGSSYTFPYLIRTSFRSCILYTMSHSFARLI